MKIRVVPQIYYKQYKWQDAQLPVFEDVSSDFWREHNFITIRHSAEKNPFCAIPVTGDNILRLQFDDATENPAGDLHLFDSSMAAKIQEFTAGIDRNKELFINCAAGVSRSGAVGNVLNEYFNRTLEYNPLEDYYFRKYNPQIQPNSLVQELLRATFSKG